MQKAEHQIWAGTSNLGLGGSDPVFTVRVAPAQAHTFFAALAVKDVATLHPFAAYTLHTSEQLMLVDGLAQKIVGATHDPLNAIVRAR